MKMAERAGFAEADPKLDLDGTDAAQKLILLARAAFGTDLSLSQIDREGIESVNAERIEQARREGKAIKLVANCRHTLVGIEASVRPREIPLSHPFAKTSGADNCVIFESRDGRTEILRGRGGAMQQPKRSSPIFSTSVKASKQENAAAAGSLLFAEVYR